MKIKQVCSSKAEIIKQVCSSKAEIIKQVCFASKIKRAVKCAAVKPELEKVMEVAKKSGIHGLEVQEIFPLLEEISFEKRGKIIIETLQNYPITSLVYHFPLKYGLEETSFAKKFDLASLEGEYIFKLTEDTIKEAAFVGDNLNIKEEILINVHLLGFTEQENITFEEREKKLKLGEERLKELTKIADYYSQKFGVKLALVRENNPPECDEVISMLDQNPKDTLRTAGLGIGVNLDFAHLWLNILYQQNGKGEFPGADFNKKIYPEINLEKTVKTIAAHLKLLHMNDAGPGYQQEFEGLEIGKGTVTHDVLIPLICENISADVIGTYELKYGHKDPESILRSDLFYRNLFREKFEEYFI